MTERSVEKGDGLARGTVINLAAHILPLLVGVISMPFVVKGLGSERFGILGLVWAVLAYLSIFDFGLSRATTNFVARLASRGEMASIARYTGTTVILQAVLGLIGGLIIAGVTPFAIEYFLRIPEALTAEAKATFLLLALSVPPFLVFNLYRGVLEGVNRFGLASLVRSPLNASVFFVPLIGVLLDWGLPAIMVGLVACRVAGLIAIYLLCVRVLPEAGGLPRFDRAAARDLVGFGSWVSVSSVVSPLLVYSDRFILGAMVSLTAVSYYTAPFELVTRLLVIPGSFVATLYPHFSRLGENGDSDRLNFVVTRSLKYLLLLVGVTVIVIVALSREILSLWLGPEFGVRGAGALQILAVGVLANSVAQVAYSLLQGFGRPDLPAKFHLIELPLHLVLATSLIAWLGVPGAALAWLARSVIDAGLLAAAALKVGGLSVRAFSFNRVFQTAAVILIAMAIVFTVSTGWLTTPVRTALLASCFVAVPLVTWCWLLVDEERHLLADGIRSRLLFITRS